MIDLNMEKVDIYFFHDLNSEGMEISTFSTVKVKLRGIPINQGHNTQGKIYNRLHGYTTHNVPNTHSSAIDWFNKQNKTSRVCIQSQFALPLRCHKWVHFVHRL